jgi:hypothetical protein
MERAVFFKISHDQYLPFFRIPIEEIPPVKWMEYGPSWLNTTSGFLTYPDNPIVTSLSLNFTFLVIITITFNKE